MLTLVNMFRKPTALATFSSYSSPSPSRLTTTPQYLPSR